MRARMVVSLVLVGLAAVSGCARPAPSDGEVDVLRIATRPYLTYAPLYVADQRGFFAELGIEVEYVNLESSTQGIPLLVNGALDILPAPISPGFLHAIASGEDIRFVADKGWVDPDGCSFLALVGRADAFEQRSGSGVDQSVRVSLSRDPQLQFFIDRAFRERFGMEIDDEAIEGLNIPENAEVVALGAGSLDGALMSGPPLLRAIDIEGVDLLAGIETVLPGYQFSGITFGPRLLNENPDLGRRFMVAYLRGVRAYQEGKTPENLAALSATTGLGESELEESCWMPVRSDGLADTASMLEYIEWYIEKGWLESAPAVEQFWDASFVDYANEEIAGSDIQGDE